MVKTYRALGVAAMVALICLALDAVYLISMASQPPLSGSITDVPSPALFVLWSYTILLFAPILSAFSVVVAGQSRAWKWLIAFVVTGIVAMYGFYIPFFVPQVFDFFLHIDLALHHNMPPAGTLAEDMFSHVILQAIPAVAALLFVGLKLRAPMAAQASTGLAPQA